MPDKPRDPLDEPDDLLADDEPTDSAPLPEPPPSPIDEPPEPPSFVWEGPDDEPVPSEIEVLEDDDGVPEVDAESDTEPPGDDLYWAEVDEDAVEEAAWHEVEEPTVLDWPIDDEEQVEDEDWADLEESRRLLPVGRLLVGLEERAALPDLGLAEVSVIMDTGRTGSVLGGGAAAPISTTVCIGTSVLTLLLERVDGPAVLRLGQDAIAGRFVVDPAQRMVLSTEE
ncbi:MAG: hypothetical protein ACI8RZ_003286 [Myxococcota bacterium]|jgi:hypothetical protein